tara:strand:+ start:3260 stop:4453 length:1194 start_codon:yes stop_codon:yes gene_type:complete
MMTPEQMKQIQLMNSPGFRAAVQARPASNTPSMAPPAAAPQAPQGLLARMGAGIQNFRSDPEKMARLQMGLNSMRLNPDAGIAASAGNTIKQAQERRMLGANANSTIAYLKAQPNNPMAKQALAMIEADPSSIKEVLVAFRNNQFKPEAMPKTIGTVQVAQEDMVVGEVTIKKGNQYVINHKPGIGYSAVDLGTTGQTAADKNNMALDLQKSEWDLSAGQKKGEEVFRQFNLIDDQIQSFARAGELVDEGAKTGFVQKFLPSTSAATTELRQIANKMGIDIINSATFGALSATELRLALETGFDQNLSGDALVEYIQNKIAAQTKLRNALMPEVQMLLGGSGLKAYADYKIDNRKRHDAAQDAFSQIQKNIPSLTAEEWRDYNLEEREAVMRDGGLL